MTRLTRLFIATALFPTTLFAADKPNILFIFCDDLGYGDVGVFHQNERAAKNDRSIPFFTTPQLDAMAYDGMVFKQHYCAAPVCAPSRASLLTGLTQGHATIRNNQFDKELPDTHTLGSVLSAAGYATTAIGKWGLQGAPDTPEERDTPTPAKVDYPGWPSLPIDRGFDDFFGYVRHRDGHYHYPVEDKKQVWHNRKEVSTGMELCFTTDLFTAYAKKWIVDHKQKSPDQPFFVYLAYDTPHAKLQNPPCAYPGGGGLKGGVQWIGKPKHMINTATGSYDGWVHPDYAKATWDHDKNPDTAEIQWPEVQKRYANNVRRIDDGVGDLLALLDDLKLANDTLVIFSSDNGPSEESYIEKHPYTPNFFHGFGPFDGIKRDTLEGGMRVPTIVRWKGTTTAGSTNEKPNAHYDWLATFADAAGLPTPAASDGVSLLPTLTGKPDQQAASFIYSEYAVGGKTPKYPEFDKSHRGKVRNQMQVVFVDGYKGLRTGIKSADDDFEIYDLAKDPKELNNLAGKPPFGSIQAKMKARVLQSRLPLESAKRPYDGELIPGVEENDLSQPGSYWFVLDGKLPWMPDFRHAPRLLGLPVDFQITAEGQIKNHQSLVCVAAVHLPKDGHYTFKLTADSHSMLKVHDIHLLDESAEAMSRTATLPLKAGWHPLRVYYRRGPGQSQLNLKITGPNGKPVPLNMDTLRCLRSER